MVFANGVCNLWFVHFCAILFWPYFTLIEKHIIQLGGFG